jgi:hypothetical protein
MPLLLALLGWATAGPPTVASRPVSGDEPSIEAKIDELESSLARDRRLAAIQLRRETRRMLRDSERQGGDEIRSLEARQTLMVFDDKLAPVCTEQLGVANLTALCAEILGLLETEAALPALETVLAEEHRAGVRKRVARAIERIRGART